MEGDSPHTTLQLKIDEQELEALSKLKADINWRIEHGTPLSQSLFDELIQQMQQIIQHQHLPTESLTSRLHLTHARNDILNLPWQLAFKASSSTNLLISKGLATSLPLALHIPTNPLPLKILIMISSPEDQQVRGRLNYEEEEANIIQAFQELKMGNSVEIDFTDNGSLAALERKLAQKHYHILHIIAHGTYDEPLQTGYLMLEDDSTLKGKKEKGKEIAQLLEKHAQHRPTLVLLASCQTAAGSSGDEFRGITNQILQAKIPAVIAMSISILDSFASAFTAQLYEQLAGQQPLPQAFQAAVLHIKEKEQTENQDQPPVQWIIPQLYFNEGCEHIIPWAMPVENALTGPTTIEQSAPTTTFIGRRKEIAQLLPQLLKNESIFIYGAGGFGKTALAEQLIYKYRLQQSDTSLITISCKNRELGSIVQELAQLSAAQGKPSLLPIEGPSSSQKQVQHGVELVRQLQKSATLIFLLDGLEEGQEYPGGPFKTKDQEILIFLSAISEEQLAPVLITGRYNHPALAQYHTFNLGGLNYQDFWKKCSTLELRNLHREPMQIRQVGKKPEGLTFNRVTELLYLGIEGNVWLLETLDLLYRKQEGQYYQTEEKLVDFLDEQEGQLTRRYEDYLGFPSIWSALSDQEKEVLMVLFNYRQAVSTHAIRIQLRKKRKRKKIAQALQQLIYLGLVEQHYLEWDKKRKRPFYIIPNSIKLILEDRNADHINFSHSKAGFHFFYVAYLQRRLDLTSWIWSFWHYHKAERKSYVKLLSRSLLHHYVINQAYEPILQVGEMTESFLQEETPAEVLDALGQYWLTKGDHDKALGYFEKALGKRSYFNSFFRIRVQNNLGLLHYQLSNFESAEHMLLKVYRKRWLNLNLSLMIHNNLALVKAELGKNEEALKLFKTSLKINRFTSRYLEHPDQSERITSSMGQILVNMNREEEAAVLLEKAMADRKRSDSDPSNNPLVNNLATSLIGKSPHKALYYQEKALKQAQKTGNLPGEATALNNLAYIYIEEGKLARSKAYLKRAISISQQLKNKSIEGLCLHNLGLYHYRKGQLEVAIEHYKQSLELLQEVYPADHAKIIEGNHVVGEIYVQSKQYGEAISYLEAAWQQTARITNTEQLELASSLAYCYSMKGRYQSAIALYETLVASYPRVDKAGVDDLYLDLLYLSDAYSLQQQDEKALTALLSAQKLVKEQHKLAGTNLGPLLNRLGGVYTILGEIGQAIASYKQILEGEIPAEWLEQNKSTILFNLGYTYASAKNNDIAFRYLKQALKQSQQDKEPYLYIREKIHLELGRLWRQKKEYEKAGLHYLAALQIAEGLNQQVSQAMVYHNMGWLAFDQANLEGARQAFQQAIALNAHKHPLWMTLHWRGLASVELDAENFSLFVKSIQEAIRVSVEYQEVGNLEEICRYLLAQIQQTVIAKDQREEWLKETQQLLLPTYPEYAASYQTALSTNTNPSEDDRQD